MASFIQMSHQGIGRRIRQAERKFDLVTVLDAEQASSGRLNFPPQQTLQRIRHGTVQRSDFDDGDPGRTLQSLCNAIGVGPNQATRPKLNTTIVTNDRSQDIRGNPSLHGDGMPFRPTTPEPNKEGLGLRVGANPRSAVPSAGQTEPSRHPAD